MADHPTRETIDRYRQGTLTSTALIAVDDHLTSCESCRAMAETDLTAGASAWRAALGPDRAVEHPAYEQWEAYVDGRLDPVDLEVLQTHLADCPSCSADVGDLRSFRVALEMAVPESSRVRDRSRLDWWLGLLKPPVLRVAVPVGALGLAAVVWMLVPRSVVAPAGTAVSTAVAPTVQAPPAVVARVQDTLGPVTLDAEGRLQGLPPLLDAERILLQRALSEGRLPFPSRLRDVITSSQTLMGRGDTSPAFEVVAPLAIVVESDRPEFTWKARPGATAYVVVIYDDQFNSIAESPSVSGLSWRPTPPIDRGRVYTWQVRALTPEGMVSAPRPPAPEARFAVISAADAERIASLRAQAPPSRLRLVVAYAQAGMLDAAQRELQALERLNPGSPVLSALADQLHAIRR